MRDVVPGSGSQVYPEGQMRSSHRRVQKPVASQSEVAHWDAALHADPNAPGPARAHRNAMPPPVISSGLQPKPGGHPPAAVHACTHMGPPGESVLQRPERQVFPPNAGQDAPRRSDPAMSAGGTQTRTPSTSSHV